MRVRASQFGRVGCADLRQPGACGGSIQFNLRNSRPCTRDYGGKQCKQSRCAELGEAGLQFEASLIVANRGAYSLVKANMFNGVNLPAIYGLATDGQLTLKRRFSYEDFLGRCGIA